MFWLCVLSIFFSVSVILSVLVVCSDDLFTVSVILSVLVNVILSVLVVCSDYFVLSECDNKCSGLFVLTIL